MVYCWAHFLLLMGFCLLPIAYCLLLIAFCLLPIGYCLLLFAYCLLPFAYCLLLIAFCLLLIAYCLLLIAFCLLPIAYCLLPFAYCLLLVLMAGCGFWCGFWKKKIKGNWMALGFFDRIIYILFKILHKSLQLSNPSTFQPINFPTRQLSNPSTFQPVNFSTFQLFNPSTLQLPQKPWLHPPLRTLLIGKSHFNQFMLVIRGAEKR